MARRLVIAVSLAAAALISTGCGSNGIGVEKSDPGHTGAQIFAQRCGACHTLKAAGTQGSTTDVSDREAVDGPNFDSRQETADDVLFAIANGGFSGAIMPENIVTGEEARQVAQFVSKYAGSDTKPNSTPAPDTRTSAGAAPTVTTGTATTDTGTTTPAPSTTSTTGAAGE
jgi:mono/diheme cytochrome c family protein